MSFNLNEEYDSTEESQGTYYGFGSFKGVNAFQNPWLLNHSGEAENHCLQYFDLNQNFMDQNKQPLAYIEVPFSDFFEVDKMQHFPQFPAIFSNMPPVVHPFEYFNMNGHAVDIAGGLVEDQNYNARYEPGINKGHWSNKEDQRLKRLVGTVGEKRWSDIAKSFKSRTGKQCRERWNNHLRPGIKENSWTEEEENTLIEAHYLYGNKWVQIAKFLPGRSENSIKNHWNSNKRKNFNLMNSASKKPRRMTALQEYIASVVQNGQEGNSTPYQVKNDMIMEPEEMVYAGVKSNLNLSQVNLNLSQVLALSSDDVIPVGTFSELLGFDVNNMYATEFVPSSRYVFCQNIGPTYFGQDVGCSSSHGAPSESADDFMDFLLMSSEKTNSVHAKGKEKMFFF